MIQEGSG